MITCPSLFCWLRWAAGENPASPSLGIMRDYASTRDRRFWMWGTEIWKKYWLCLWNASPIHSSPSFFY